MRKSFLNHNYIVPHKNLDVNRSTKNSPKQIDTHRDSLKMYPELNEYALKNNLVKELSTLYFLKYLNEANSGYLRYDYALENLQKVFKMSRTKAYELLSKINGAFITEFKNKNGDRVIKLISLNDLSTMCNINFLHIPIFVDIKQCQKLSNIKAWFMGTSCYTIDDSTNKTNPLPHKTIEEKTGLNTRTQQRYNKLLPLKIQSNFKDELTIYTGKNKEYVCFKNLGNNYYLKTERCCIGIIKHINKKLKSKSKDKQPSKSGETSVVKKFRTFFHDVKDYLSCKIKSQQPLITKSHGTDYFLWSNPLKV